MPEQQLVPYLYEREATYFGFLPATFTDTLIHAVNHYAQIALDSLQEFIDIHTQSQKKSTATPSTDALDLVSLANEQAMQRAASLLESALDKCMDRWELYCLRVIFHVPPSFPLQHDAWTLKAAEGQEEQRQRDMQQMHADEEMMMTLRQRCDELKQRNRRLVRELALAEQRLALQHQFEKEWQQCIAGGLDNGILS